MWTEDFDQQQAGTDDDAAIGDVEVGPVVVDDVDFEEVDDVGETNAVVEVADSAAEDECERNPRERKIAAYAPEHAENDDDGDDGEGDETVADDDGRGRVEERKRRAGVEYMREAEDSGNDRDSVARIDVVDDPELAAAVGHDDQRCEQEKRDAAVPSAV